MTVTFKKYYEKLQNEENAAHLLQLIHKWDKNDITIIEKDFKSAINASNIFAQKCISAQKSSNQSAGNKFEKHFICIINPKLTEFTIENCLGKGYPDKQLKNIATKIIYPLEIKATSNFNSKDSNRRVLTCSSKKLIKNFSKQKAINHIIVTLIYDKSSWCIAKIRLDFLAPSSLVNVRLEASTSHKLLENRTHHSVIIL